MIEEERQESFLQELSPIWMFHRRPADFQWFGKSICPGVFWLPGMFYLLAFHIVSFQVCWFLWSRNSDWTLLALLPLCLLWTWLISADIKFRIQHPSRREREGFDNEIINWFGFVATLVVYFIIIPISMIGVTWWCLNSTYS